MILLFEPPGRAEGGAAELEQVKSVSGVFSNLSCRC